MSPEQVALIDGTLRKVKHCDPAAVEAGELLLVQQASQLGYQDLTTVAAKLVEAIDPDGILPCDEAEHRLRRFFHLKQRKDGCWVGDFRLTPQVGQQPAALLDPLMHPRTTTIQPEDADGVPGRNRVLPDERTPGQRRHDALAEVLDAVLRTDELPATGGTPTKIDEQMGTSSSKTAGDRRKKQPAAATGMTASAAVAAGEHRHQLFATV